MVFQIFSYICLILDSSSELISINLQKQVLTFLILWRLASMYYSLIMGYLKQNKRRNCSEFFFLFLSLQLLGQLHFSGFSKCNFPNIWSPAASWTVCQVCFKNRAKWSNSAKTQRSQVCGKEEKTFLKWRFKIAIFFLKCSYLGELVLKLVSNLLQGLEYILRYKGS